MMNTIKATLEASADGTVHVPLPPELRHGMLRVTATVEALESESVGKSITSLKGFGCLKGKMWMSEDFDMPLEEFKEYME